MASALVLDHVALNEHGPTLVLSLEAGQSLAIAGRAGAGKSELLYQIAAGAAEGRGIISRNSDCALAKPLGISRRSRPQSLAATATAGLVNSHARASDTLAAIGLWEPRRRTIAELSTSQVSAAELIPPLASAARLLLIDGQLDNLDVVTFQSTLALVKRRLEEGAAAIIATNRPEIVEQLDGVVVLKNREVAFAGSPKDLIRMALPSRIEVETRNVEGARALVQAFEVSLEVTADGVRLEAAEGQAIAARLLVEGYGDVRLVVLREPTMAEALQAVM